MAKVINDEEDKVKIIFVGQYYWPDNFLINEITEELVNRGHTVTVLTGLPDYTTNLVPKEYKRRKNRHEIRNGVEIFRVPIIARHTGIIYRILNYLSFFLSSSIFAYVHHFEADIIFAYQTAPVLMGNAAIILKKKLKKPLFFYCLDIWPDQMKIWGILENNPLFKLMKAYSRYAYKSGDLVGITSMPFKKYLIEVNHVNEQNIVYLPQHSARMNLNQLDEKNYDKETIDLMFAGNIGKQQNVECLLKAVARIHTDKKYKVHIYGDGTAYDTCKQLAEKLNICDRVIFYGRVPKSKLDLIYPRMDAFLLTLRSEKQIGFSANTVPAKFQGYLSAEKPILAAIDGGAKEIIDQIGCGKAVAADDDKGFAEIITEFINNPKKFKNQGVLGKKYFDENYDKKIVMDLLENYLKKLIQVKG